MKYNCLDKSEFEGIQMKEEITLKPMTPEMYHAFFKEYQNDKGLFLDKNDFYEYRYDKANVDAYI